MGSACGKSTQPVEEPMTASPPKSQGSPDTTPAAAPEAPPPKAEPAKVEPEYELSSENLLPADQAFDTVNMDAPKPRKVSIQKGSSDSPKPTGQRRFRKRSVNITTLPDEQLAVVESIFHGIDSEGTGFISREDVAQILKENYKPTDVDVQEVMSWLDGDGDGTVSFDEYSVAFASVMTKAGLNSVADIETARAALSAEMTKLSSEKKPDGDAQVADMPASEENVNNARKIIGEENLQHMKDRFQGLDTDSKGHLTREEVKELVRLTYVAPPENINTFMKFFHEDAAEKGITLAEFKHGLTLLYGDFTFMLKAQSRMVDGKIVSP